jgi:DNA (cytosine-5)-methyltransferase 1
MCRCRPELRDRYPDLITPCRPLLDAWGGLYVIENVAGAKAWMKNPVCVCMWGHFGRELYRHRLLEAGGGLVLTLPRPPASVPSPGTSVPDGYVMSGNPGRPNRECGLPHPVRAAKAGHWKPGWFVSVAGHERKEPVRRVMEIDESWVPRREDVSEAIPPYMAAWVMGELASWRESEAA